MAIKCNLLRNYFFLKFILYIYIFIYTNSIYIFCNFIYTYTYVYILLLLRVYYDVSLRFEVSKWNGIF